MIGSRPRTVLGAAGALVLGGALLGGAVAAQSPSVLPAASPGASIDPCAVPAASPTASLAAVVASPAASILPEPSPVATLDPCAGPAITKVSANTATREELIAALEAAGVSRADRWAREIEEYRPYDTADPTLQHLQDELAKYNPDPATLAAILSVLEP
jgi:hypothetical protein